MASASYMAAWRARRLAAGLPTHTAAPEGTAAPRRRRAAAPEGTTAAPRRRTAGLPTHSAKLGRLCSDMGVIPAGKRHVRRNGVAPGMTRTEMAAALQRRNAYVASTGFYPERLLRPPPPAPAEPVREPTVSARLTSEQAAAVEGKIIRDHVATMDLPWIAWTTAMVAALLPAEVRGTRKANGISAIIGRVMRERPGVVRFDPARSTNAPTQLYCHVADHDRLANLTSDARYALAGLLAWPDLATLPKAATRRKHNRRPRLAGDGAIGAGASGAVAA